MYIRRIETDGFSMDPCNNKKKLYCVIAMQYKYNDRYFIKKITENNVCIKKKKKTNLT